MQVDVGRAPLREIQRSGGISRRIARNADETVQLCCGHCDGAVEIKLFDADNRRPGDVITGLKAQGVLPGAAVQHGRQRLADRDQIVVGAAKQAVAQPRHQKIIVVAAKKPVKPDAAIHAVVAVQAVQRVVACVAAQTVGTGCRGDAVSPAPGIGIDRGAIARGKGDDVRVARAGQREIDAQRGRKRHSGRAALGQGNLRRGVAGGIARNQREATQLCQGQLNVSVQEKLLDAKDGGPGNIVAAFDPQRVKVGATIQGRRQISGHRNQVVARAAKGHIAGSGENVVIAIAAIHLVRPDAAIKAVVAVQS